MDDNATNEMPSAGNREIIEKITRRIILRFIHPTAASENTRRKVIDYLRSLIRNCTDGCEVFPYGSVPLKTYLPDGDIDLTVFGGGGAEEELANNIVSELQREEKSSRAEFVVKEIRLIHAKVKLVKCLVQNIKVDISFNQIGGLSGLCFLELVDRLTGKDNLFKRSIILIKAWCCYEGCILGAQHRLLSTYALEILVLYIVNVFHSTLNGPLAVLHRFLDYFSKFDWENYCISLAGPVHVSSLQEIVAETPENSGGNLLLTEDFYRDCANTFLVPSQSTEINPKTFRLRHMNIIDPLKEYNNLGRSVSKGNYYWIRHSFTYGAQKLGQILMQPQDSITVELQIFFSNTLNMHASGQRPDIQYPFPISRQIVISLPAFSVSETESSAVEKVSSGANSSHRIGTSGDYNRQNPNENRVVSEILQAPDEDNGVNVLHDLENKVLGPARSQDIPSVPYPVALSSESHKNWGWASASDAGCSESLISLINLSGDLSSYFDCFQYGRCSNYSLNMPALSMPPPTTCHYKSINSWGPIPLLVPSVSFGLEETPKPRGTGVYVPTGVSLRKLRGTGVYFSNMKRPTKGYRSSPMVGRNQVTDRSPSTNGFAYTASKFPVYQSGGVPVPSYVQHSGSPRRKVHPNVNGSILQTFVQGLPTSATQRTNAVTGMDQNRCTVPSCYHLEDEDDFPTLSI